MKVLIADDEVVVLEGLKYIIDWENLGFSICSQSKNGEETLEKILRLQPDLVLLDIRMPRLSGTEIVQIARENGFRGHFIILSGYSDFSYAQTAIKYGVDFYLTKPIDEEELENAVLTVKKQIEDERKSAMTLNQYRENARDTIIRSLLTGSFKDISSLNLTDLHLSTDIYQVVMYERFTQDPFQVTWDFAELLRVTNQDHNSFDHVSLERREVILLKGSFALDRFERLLSHYHVNPQKGSPLDSLFLTYGRRVYRPEDITYSYEDACALLERRFFCEHNQHVLGYEALPSAGELTYRVTDEEASRFSSHLTDYIQTQNRRCIVEELGNIRKNLYYCADQIPAIKRFLIDIYLQIRQKISQVYVNIQIPFCTNSAMIDSIDSKFYLYEILNLLNEQFEMCMNAIGCPSSDTIMDDILHYINYNYMENLKLETIAPLFGYNSAYLGKIFTKKVGESFNSYLDRIRIDHSKLLLKDESLKVYEIAERIGYKNVDYFHKKFRKYVGQSPAEYRKTAGLQK
ncbi:MAG: response regulator [Eubacteriales bacterium]|nr:response regulator [Eubacteriales bacterium]